MTLKAYELTGNYFIIEINGKQIYNNSFLNIKKLSKIVGIELKESEIYNIDENHLNRLAAYLVFLDSNYKFEEIKGSHDMIASLIIDEKFKCSITLYSDEVNITEI